MGEKKMKALKTNRILLIKYTCHSGEYEFSGHATITLTPRQKPETQVHNYFKDFYGEGNTEDFNKLDSYTYNLGEVAVDDISYRFITQEQYEVLKEVGLGV
jgi:hypothetical protein